jgi:hypothetical protein
MNSLNTIVFISLLVCAGCNEYSSNNNIKNMETQQPNNKGTDYEPQHTITMRFDIIRFENNNKYNKYRFVDSDGMEVFQWAITEFPSGKVEEYIEERNFPNSPYTFYSEYDDKGNIIKYIKLFSGFHIGIGLYYDSTGNIVKEEDFDAAYPFSVDDLINKMKEEYDADLLNNNNGYTSRGIEQEHLEMPLYIVNYFIADTPFRDIYLINGTTGETLYITKRFIMESDTEEEEPVLDEYIRKKANGEL